MSLRVPSRFSFVTVLAIFGLVGSIAFGAARLVQANAGFREVDSHSNPLWITQAQTDAFLFSEIMALVAAGALPSTDSNIAQRFTLLMSRIGFLLDDPQRRQIGAVGIGPIIAARESLLVAEPRIRAGLDREAALRLQSEMGQFGNYLRQLAEDSIRLDRDETFAARDLYRRIIVEAAASAFGVLLSATILSYRLFEGAHPARRAEPLLRHKPVFSNLVINPSDQGILVVDENRTCLFWDLGMQSLFRVAPKDAIGRPIEASVELFGSPELSAIFDPGVRGTTCTIEDMSSGAGSPARRLEINCHPMSLSERRLVIASVRDVTEGGQADRKLEQHNQDLLREVEQRRQALRQAEGCLAAAIEASPEGFAAFSNDRLFLANERIRNIEPVASCYWDGMPLTDFLACFATCEGGDHRLLEATQLAHGAIELELRLGTETWVHLSVTQTEPGSTIVRLSDVTSYKKTTLALQSALDREREVTSAYRSFVSMVSHQFRTPLAIVDSSAQRILRRVGEATSDELAMRVKKIRNATVRLTRLVEGVLNVAKIDSGQIEIRPSLCNLVELVAEVCERQRDITPAFVIRFIAPSHPVELMCDPMLMEQVLVNLLTNAVKYSGTSTEIEVRLWLEGDIVHCSVRDWGLGIPEDELPKVFDRFYRGRTAAGIAGTGIGLNIAREIVRMHGGHIHVESSEALGSVFNVSIPTRNALAAPQAA